MSHSIKPAEILLVDDSPSDTLLATKAFEQAKMPNHVHAVGDGVEAMLFLRRQGKYQNAPRPDLVLLDLNLPRKDGWSVLAEVKADGGLNHIPIIILTTSTNDEDLAEAYRLHANCYIAKPMEFSKLVDLVHSIENFWFETVTLPPGQIPLTHPAPALLPLSGAGPKTAPMAPKRPNQALRILLVEDNPTDVLLLESVLADATSIRSELVHVERLSQAIEKLRSERFDTVLTDLGLPDSRGLDTFLRIQTEAKNTPVIVLTSLDDEEFGLNAMQSGAQDYLVKHDVSESLLSRSIRYAIERRSLEEQLRQSQRLEAIGQLAGGVAHDFNNLLTVIQGYASMIQSGDVVRTKVEAAQEILNAAERAEALIRQLLAFSRKQAMHSKNLDVNKILAQMSKMLNRTLGEDICLLIQSGTDLPPVRADAGMLEQVILNLTVNARDAMPRGGNLSISTRFSIIDEDSIRGRFEAAAGEFVTITVQDTGTGIAPEILPRIFEPFFTTKDVGKGTGLGLATVYGIVKQHMGWVDVKSKFGEGTTFHIHFPALRDIVLPASEMQDEKLEIVRGAETILVVEDDVKVRSLIVTLLARHGYKVLEAFQALEALHVWNRHRSEIDLLLTDMVLPDGMNGRELAEKLVAEKESLKVIFNSGYSHGSFGDRMEFLKPGQKFLPKPFVPADLLRIVRDTLDEK